MNRVPPVLALLAALTACGEHGGDRPRASEGSVAAGREDTNERPRDEEPVPQVTAVNGVHLPAEVRPSILELVTFDGSGVPELVVRGVGEEAFLGEEVATPQRILLDDLREAWTAPALLRAAREGRLDLDLPLAMHLPVLARPGTSAITARMILDHTAHLGGNADEWNRRRATLDTLAAQTYLASLGPSDTPGQRPSWHVAHVDLQLWLAGALDLEAPAAASIPELAEAVHRWRRALGANAATAAALDRLALGSTAAITGAPFEGATALTITNTEAGTRVLALHGTEATLAARLDAVRADLAR